MSRLVAVLTGDIVKSSAMPPGRLDEIFATLKDATRLVTGWTHAPVPGERFARFRGDGWQFLLADPALALRACLYIRARLFALSRSHDSRIACGIGAGQLGQGLMDAEGPAFLASGRLLDGFGRNRRLGLDSGLSGDLQQLGSAVFSLADTVSGGWTERQARVFAEALLPDPPIQADIAARLKISQQSVSEHLKAGGHGAILESIAAFEGLQAWDDHHAE